METGRCQDSLKNSRGLSSWVVARNKSWRSATGINKIGTIFEFWHYIKWDSSSCYVGYLKKGHYSRKLWDNFIIMSTADSRSSAIKPCNSVLISWQAWLGASVGPTTTTKKRRRPARWWPYSNCSLNSLDTHVILNWTLSKQGIRWPMLGVQV